MEKDGVFLGDLDLACSSKDALITVLVTDAHLFGNNSASSQDCNIVEDGLAVVSKTRGLDSCHRDASLDLVNNQVGKGLALDIISDDQERSLLLDCKLNEFEDLVEV